jgi:hypothetical protein
VKDSNHIFHLIIREALYVHEDCGLRGEKTSLLHKQDLLCSFPCFVHIEVISIVTSGSCIGLWLGKIQVISWLCGFQAVVSLSLPGLLDHREKCTSFCLERRFKNTQPWNLEQYNSIFLTWFTSVFQRERFLFPTLELE